MVDGLDKQQASQFLGTKSIDFAKLDAADGNKDGVIDLSKVQLFAKDKDGKMVRVTSTDQLTDGSLSFNTTQTVSSVDMNVKGLHVESNNVHIGGDAASIDAKGEHSIVDLDEATIKGENTTTQTILSKSEFADPNFNVPNSIAKSIKGYDASFDTMLRKAGVNDVNKVEENGKQFIQYKSATGWSVKIAASKDGTFRQPNFLQDEETGAVKFGNIGANEITFDGVGDVILGPDCNGAKLLCKDGVQENVVVGSNRNVVIETNEKNDEINTANATNTTIKNSINEKAVYQGNNLVSLSQDDSGNKDIKMEYNSDTLSKKTYTDKEGKSHVEQYDESGKLLRDTVKDKQGNVEEFKNGVISKKEYADGTKEEYDKSGLLSTREKGNKKEFFEDGILKKYEVKSQEKAEVFPLNARSSKEVLRNNLTTYDANGSKISMVTSGKSSEDNYYRKQEFDADGTTIANDVIKKNGAEIYKKETKPNVNGGKNVVYTRITDQGYENYLNVIYDSNGSAVSATQSQIADVISPIKKIDSNDIASKVKNFEES